LRDAEECGDDRLLLQARRPLPGRERLRHELPVGVVERAGRDGRRRRSSNGSPREREGRNERQERGGGPQRRRNDHSLLPMKLTGVTSTIAIACAVTSPTPPDTSRCKTTRFAASASAETTRNRRPWCTTWPRWRLKVQMRFHV